MTTILPPAAMGGNLPRYLFLTNHNQFHPVVREDVLDDRLKALKELFDIGFREVSELEAWVRGDDTE